MKVQDLTNIIADTQNHVPWHKHKLQSKEKWFNWTCLNARKHSFECLRSFNRTGTKLDRVLYIRPIKTTISYVRMQKQIITIELRASLTL